MMAKDEARAGLRTLLDAFSKGGQAALREAAEKARRKHTDDMDPWDWAEVADWLEGLAREGDPS